MTVMIPRLLVVAVVATALLATPVAASELDVSVSASDRADQGARVPVQVTVIGAEQFDRIEVVLDSSHTTVTVVADRERSGLYTAVVPTADVDPGTYQLYARAVDENEQVVATSDSTDFQLYGPDQGDGTGGDVDQSTGTATDGPSESTEQSNESAVDDESTANDQSTANQSGESTPDRTDQPTQTDGSPIRGNSTADVPPKEQSGVSTDGVTASNTAGLLAQANGTMGVLAAFVGVVLVLSLLVVRYVGKRK